MNTVAPAAETLALGLGYLTLGEETPSLSGGEAQRLKLASEMGRTQTDTVFVFDEPTIGLHPLDVRVLLGVFQTLLDQGATVVVIEHDLDVIRSADYIIDMGPGGGEAGGRIVACGTPEEIRRQPRQHHGQIPVSGEWISFSYINAPKTELISPRAARCNKANPRL